MIRSRLRILAALPLVLSAACVQQDMGGQRPTLTQVPPPAGEPRADINRGYVPGRTQLPDAQLPTLSEMQEMRAARRPSASSDEDRLRAPALRDAALSYGARGGLAWASKQVNRMLEDRAGELTRVYDFNRLLIRSTGGATVMPPVIVESRDTYEQADAGRTLRVADTYYEIIEQARFAPVAPLWHGYLMTSFSTPEQPDQMVLPKNDGERDLWRKFVAEGWERGVQQAMETYRINLARLTRDFTGMLKYAELLERGQVSAPVVADSNMGVTGSGRDMRVNDRAYRITADPRLNVQRPSEWRPAVSANDPTEAATPPGGTPGARGTR